MKKSRNSEAKTNIQSNKFKWKDPELVDLTNARKRSRGVCSDGSGA